MKIKMIITIALVTLALATQATIHTVSVNDVPAKFKIGNGTGEWSSLEALINSSNIGVNDTLYLHPGAYGSQTISKNVTLVGIGHQDYRSATGTVATFTNLTLNNVTLCRIIGIKVTNTVGPYPYLSSNNVYLERCWFKVISFQSYNSNLDYSNWTFIGNVITDKISYNRTDTKIDNLFFYNNVFTSTAYFENFNAGNAARVTLVNNVFLGTHATPVSVFSGTAAYFQMQKNVFYGRTFTSTSVAAVELYDNIIYTGGLSGMGDLPTGTSGDGNVFNTDPAFISFSPPSGNYSYSYNLKRAAYATDGIGLDNSFNRYGTPFTPFVTNVQIVNRVVSQGGTLRFKVSGESKVQEN